MDDRVVVVKTLPSLLALKIETMNDISISSDSNFHLRIKTNIHLLDLLNFTHYLVDIADKPFVLTVSSEQCMAASIQISVYLCQTLVHVLNSILCNFHSLH